MKLQICILILGGTLAATTALAQQPTVYAVKGLGTLGGSESYASAINEKGQIVGTSKDKANRRRAFLYERGRMRDLGTLGGTEAVANDINDNGQVVGTSYAAVGGADRATLFRPGGQPLDINPPGALSSGAGAINSRGDIVGSAQTSANPPAFRGFIRQGPVSNYIATFGGSVSVALGINDEGDIVGFAKNNGDLADRPFLIPQGMTVDLGTLGGSDGIATAINRFGQIVGYTDTATAEDQAFLYSGALRIPLGSFGGQSIALAINDEGDIVGYGIRPPATLRAFLYRNGAFVDLNALLPPQSGWELGRADDINEKGQIVGTGSFKGRQDIAYLLSPDRRAPKTLVTGPQSFTTSRASVPIRGRATDDNDVAVVEVKGARGPFRKAKGTTRWSATVSLRSGQNTVSIRARDTAGRISRTVKMNVTKE